MQRQIMLKSKHLAISMLFVIGLISHITNVTYAREKTCKLRLLVSASPESDVTTQAGICKIDWSGIEQKKLALKECDVDKPLNNTKDCNDIIRSEVIHKIEMELLYLSNYANLVVYSKDANTRVTFVLNFRPKNPEFLQKGDTIFGNSENLSIEQLNLMDFNTKANLLKNFLKQFTMRTKSLVMTNVNIEGGQIPADFIRQNGYNASEICALESIIITGGSYEGIGERAFVFKDNFRSVEIKDAALRGGRIATGSFVIHERCRLSPTTTTTPTSTTTEKAINNSTRSDKTTAINSYKKIVIQDSGFNAKTVDKNPIAFAFNYEASCNRQVLVEVIVTKNKSGRRFSPLIFEKLLKEVNSRPDIDLKIDSDPVDCCITENKWIFRNIPGLNVSKYLNIDCIDLPVKVGYFENESDLNTACERRNLFPFKVIAIMSIILLVILMMAFSCICIFYVIPRRGNDLLTRGKKQKRKPQRVQKVSSETVGSSSDLAEVSSDPEDRATNKTTRSIEKAPLKVLEPFKSAAAKMVKKKSTSSTKQLIPLDESVKKKSLNLPKVSLNLDKLRKRFDKHQHRHKQHRMKMKMKKSRESTGGGLQDNKQSNEPLSEPPSITGPKSGLKLAEKQNQKTPLTVKSYKQIGQTNYKSGSPSNSALKSAQQKGAKTIKSEDDFDEGMSMALRAIKD